MSFLDSLVSGIGDIAGSIGDTMGNIGGDISSWFGGGSGDAAMFDASSLGNGGNFDSSALNFGSNLGGASGANFDVSSLTGGGSLPDVGSAITPASFSNTTSDPAGFTANPNQGGLSIPGGTASLLGGGTAAINSLLKGSGASNGATTATPSGGTVTPTGGGTTTNNGGGILGGVGNLVNGVGNFVTQNPATILAGLAPVLTSLFGNQLPSQAQTLQKQADDEMALVNNQIMPTALANQQGMINNQALNTIDQSLQRQQAAMRQAYGNMGMSGSTMEAQDLSNLDANAASQVFSTGQSMATQGLSTAASLTGQAGGWYNDVMQAQIQQDQDLENAIAEVAAAAVKPTTSTVNNNTNGGGTTSNIPGLPGGISSTLTTPMNVTSLLGSAGDGTSVIPNAAIPLTTSDPAGMDTSAVGGLSVPGLTDPNSAGSLYNGDPNAVTFDAGSASGTQLLTPQIQQMLAGLNLQAV